LRPGMACVPELERFLESIYRLRRETPSPSETESDSYLAAAGEVDELEDEGCRGRSSGAGGASPPTGSFRPARSSDSSSRGRADFGVPLNPSSCSDARPPPPPPPPPLQPPRSNCPCEALACRWLKWYASVAGAGRCYHFNGLLFCQTDPTAAEDWAGPLFSNCKVR
jgi:hypothetical protein